MNSIEKIYWQRVPIVAELYDWAETFIGEKDDENEPTLEPYKRLFDLARRLETIIVVKKIILSSHEYKQSKI